MNIIKGLDRIILVFAIAAVVPGFLFGWHISFATFKKPSPEYIEYEKELEASAIPKGQVLKELSLFRPKYIGPDLWKQAACGLAASTLTFPLVLFGLCGATRGVKWISLWIAEGFRNTDEDG